VKTPRTFAPVSRRAALATLGGGLALVTTARGAVAQDAGALHPIVGCWQNAVDDPGIKWTFSIFHADGTYHEWNGSPITAQRSAAMGVWRPSGDHSADVVFMYQQVDPATNAEFTATWRVQVVVDASGDSLTYNGELDLRAADGSPMQTLAGAWPATRVTIEHNPATGSTASRPSPVIATPVS
jgi:hypothetical protein